MNTSFESLCLLTRYEKAGKDVVSFLNASLVEAGTPVYVVLTDTRTMFSRVSKAVTGQPFNHVSLAFDEKLDKLYTYALTTSFNGVSGGIKEETREMLKGSRYSMYKLTMPFDAYDNLRKYVEERISNPAATRYNHLGLLNAIMGKDIFKNEDENKAICSEFLVTALKAVGTDLSVKGRSAVKPYDLVKHRLLKHVARGTL